jgi:hypothetical protein
MEATVTAAAAGMIDVGGDLTVNRLEYVADGHRARLVIDDLTDRPGPKD